MIAFDANSFSTDSFSVHAFAFGSTEDEHHGGFDYGEHKRKHREKEELLEESKKLITKILLIIQMVLQVILNFTNKNEKKSKIGPIIRI